MSSMALMILSLMCQQQMPATLPITASHRVQQNNSPMISWEMYDCYMLKPMKMNDYKTIDEYISNFDADKQAVLAETAG